MSLLDFSVQQLRLQGKSQTELAAEPVGPLTKHLLEAYMLSPSKWPEDGLGIICRKYRRVMKVFVDNFCTMVQTMDVKELKHVSCSILQAIYDVFPPPDILRHSGGDPISEKKLLEGEG